MEEQRRPRRQCPPPPGEPYPWLVFIHGKGFKNQTFYNLSNPPSNNNNNNSSSVRSIPELRRKKVCNSCHGWLVLSNDDYDDQFSLFNPITFESILLPRLKPDSKSSIDACTLSSPPSDPSSTLFLFDSGLRRILFCCLENRRWIEKSYKKEIDAIGKGEYNADYILHPVSCNGRLYASTFHRSKLVSIDTVEQNSDLVIRPMGIRLPDDYESLSIRTREDLVESGGELFTVITMYGGMKYTDAIGIEIFKLDFSCMVWERMESVKDRAFFLCNNYAISCNAVCSDEVRGNCVYFTREEDKSLYSYDIDEGSISVFLPCPNLPTPWKSPIWVMPDIRLQHIHSDALCITGNKKQEEEEQKEEQGNGEERKEFAEKEENEKVEKREAIKATLQLLDLPSDILKSISRLLILVDYMNFRAVCKMARQLAPAIEWRTYMSDRSHCSLTSPWFLMFEKNKGVCSLVDPIHGNKYFVRIPNSLRDATLCHCKDGWLLMCKRLTTTALEEECQHSLIFFNPFTKETIAYPALPRLPFVDVRFGFSSAPSSPLCVVVAVSFIFSHEVGVYISRSREEEWSRIELESSLIFSPSFSIPIFADKAFYFASQNGSLGVLRLEEGGYCWEILKKTQIPCNSFTHNFLAESDGELLSVFIADLGKRVRVFKLNSSTMVWERIKKLGNRTLYLSRSSALSTVAKTPKMEEKIYLPRFCGQDNIVSYSLSTGLYHYSSSGREEGSLKDYHGTREQLLCGWIEPRWH